MLIFTTYSLFTVSLLQGSAHAHCKKLLLAWDTSLQVNKNTMLSMNKTDEALVINIRLTMLCVYHFQWLKKVLTFKFVYLRGSINIVTQIICSLFSVFNSWCLSFCYKVSDEMGWNSNIKRVCIANEFRLRILHLPITYFNVPFFVKRQRFYMYISLW